MEVLSLQEIVANKWNNQEIRGWRGYIIKENLKVIKKEIKLWKEMELGVLESSISRKKDEIEELNYIDDVMGLDETNIIRRRQVTIEL
ncbi:hypothetical protein ACS0TY_034871 [Phlomoides rotata]